MLYDFSTKLPSQLLNARMHNVGLWAKRRAVERYLHQHAADTAAHEPTRSTRSYGQIAVLNAQHGFFVGSRLDTSRLCEVAAGQETSGAIASWTASLWPQSFGALATPRPMWLSTIAASYVGGTGVAATPPRLHSDAPAKFWNICVQYGLLGILEYRALCAARTLAAGDHHRLATGAQALAPGVAVCLEPCRLLTAVHAAFGKCLVACGYALWAAAWGIAAAMRHPEAGLDACIMDRSSLREAVQLWQMQGAFNDACARAAPLLAAAFGMPSRQALYAYLVTAAQSAPLRAAAKTLARCVGHAHQERAMARILRPALCGPSPQQTPMKRRFLLLARSLHPDKRAQAAVRLSPEAHELATDVYMVVQTLVDRASRPAPTQRRTPLHAPQTPHDGGAIHGAQAACAPGIRLLTEAA